jgi:hypothetical protein
VDDFGDAAVQIHEAFQRCAVDCSRGIIHDNSKPAITAEVSADDQLGLLLPASGPLDLRHGCTVPPEPNSVHPLIGKTGYRLDPLAVTFL